MFANNLLINETYKKGNSRAGCLFCPMSGGTIDYIRRKSYPKEIDGYIEIIKRMNNWDGKKDIKTYITSGGWDNRRSGRGLSGNFLRYKESCKDGILLIELSDPQSDWREWIKTIDNVHIDYDVQNTQSGMLVRVPEKILKDNPSFGKVFRQVFRKAAYCQNCRVCETNCKNGRITFDNGKVKITDCLHCLDCHNLPGGCLLFDSLKIPQGEKKMKAINCFDDHAPKSEWLTAFFNDQASFLSDNNLGPNQLTKFKRFLNDAGLISKSPFTNFAALMASIGWDSNTAQGLLLINLVCDNPQTEWYTKNMEIGRAYAQQSILDKLLFDDVKEKAAKSIAKSYKRLVETPLGTSLHWGYVTDDGGLVRTKCSVSDPRVVLYGLFKFAEKCKDYKEFTLATLLNDSIDRDGISPTRIFGLNREDMTPLLLGLTAKYPEFITASFTHDLEKITLAEDKSSSDVLKLFEEDTTNG
jgi:phosphoadenosine phosphosulfate reductase